MKLTPYALMLYAVASLTAMAPMSIGAGLVMLSLLWDARGAGGIRESFRSEYALPASRIYVHLSLFLFFACALSLVVAHFSPLVVAGHVAKVEFGRDLRKAWFLIWPFLIAIGLRAASMEERRKILLAWLFAAGALSLLGIAQVFTGFPQVQYVPNFGNTIHHATIFLGHHLSVASIFLFPFFASLEGAFAKHPPFPRKLLGVIALLTGMLLFATFSRAVWLALPAGIVVFTLLRLHGKRRWIFLSVLVLAVSGASRMPFVYERMIQMDGKSTRYELWEAHFSFFKERPLTGAGWKLGQEYSGYYLEAKHPEANGVFAGHAHNNFLEMLGGTGLLGAAAWLLWCAWIFRESYRERKRSTSSGPGLVFATAWIAAWISFHLNGLTQVNFWDGKCLHQAAFSIGWLLLWRGEREKA